MTLADTNSERNVDYLRTWFIGEPLQDSLGVRIKVVATASKRTIQRSASTEHSGRMEAMSGFQNVPTCVVEGARRHLFELKGGAGRSVFA